LVRPQNRLAFHAVLEHFLGACLGGRIEPVGAAFEGAVMQVFDGATDVPGLSAFARRAAAPPPQPVAQAVPAETGEGGPEDPPPPEAPAAAETPPTQ
jgi:hypothetical protein